MEESRRFQSTYSFKTIDRVNSVIHAQYERATYRIIGGDPPKHDLEDAGIDKYSLYYDLKSCLPTPMTLKARNSQLYAKHDPKYSDSPHC